MDWPTIPEQDDVATQMAEKQAQEDRDLDMGDVVDVEMRIETAPVAKGTDRHRRNRRDAIVAVAVTHHRRVTPWRPRTTHRRDEQKAALIEEYQVRLQAAGFFLMAHHL